VDREASNLVDWLIVTSPSPQMTNPLKGAWTAWSGYVTHFKWPYSYI